MKVTCSICQTTFRVKDEKLIKYKGKTIRVNCVNPQCDNRIKIDVPMDLLQEDKQINVCENCGKEVEENEHFCLYCGHKIENEISKTPSTGKQKPELEKKEIQYCLKCGAALNPGDRFCLKCGTPVTVEKIETSVEKKSPPKPNQKTKQKVQKQALQKEIKPEKKSTLRCKVCNEPVKKGEKFCLHCGSPLQEDNTNTPAATQSQAQSTQQAYCPACHKPVEAGEKFCPHCGNSLQKLHKTKKQKIQVDNPKPAKLAGKKKSGMHWIVKILIGIIALLGVLIAVSFFLTDDLPEGPWKVTYLNAETIYYPTQKEGAVTYKQALSKVNSTYLIDANKSQISLPDGQYEATDKSLFFDLASTKKKGNLYYSTLVEEGKKGEVKMIIDKKSSDYFEAKVYVILPDEISIGYMKGHLGKSVAKSNTKSDNKSAPDKRLLGSWITVDVKTGNKDKQGGWTFLPDGTCYQGTNSSKQARRTWKTKNNKYVTITFPEQSITYEYEIKGKNMYFERYRPYYYYQKQ